MNYLHCPANQRNDCARVCLASLVLDTKQQEQVHKSEGNHRQYMYIYVQKMYGHWCDSDFSKRCSNLNYSWWTWNVTDITLAIVGSSVVASALALHLFLTFYFLNNRRRTVVECKALTA